MEPRTYAFLLEIATLMQENICLETLVLLKSEIRIEHCFEAISALQPNTTVKTLYIQSYNFCFNHRLVMTNDLLEYQ
jgi:metal-responsive CopG/Arc/MetJ family transcriptional regulator